MQKYELAFKEDITWCIEKIENFKEFKSYDEFSSPFGICQIKEGVVYFLLHVAKINEDDMKKLSRIPAFHHEAIFNVTSLQADNTWKKIEEFKGTFIDAFKYINKNFG